MFIQKQYGNAGLDIPKHQEHPVDVQGLRLSFQLLSTTNRATLPRWNIMGSRPKSAGLEGQLMKIDHQTGPEMCLRMSTCCTHTQIYIYTYIRICIMYIPVIYIYNSMLYTCIICVLCVHLSLSHPSRKFVKQSLYPVISFELRLRCCLWTIATSGSPQKQKNSGSPGLSQLVLPGSKWPTPVLDSLKYCLRIFSEDIQCTTYTFTCIYCVKIYMHTYHIMCNNVCMRCIQFIKSFIFYNVTAAGCM